MSKGELAVVILFCVIFAFYVITFLFLFVRPPLYNDFRVLKIILFIFCMVGSFAITLKYYLDYHIIIMLVLLIIFTLCYTVGMSVIIYKSVKAHRANERLFNELRQKKLK